jgi:AraC-like DNA-binding protein
MSSDPLLLRKYVNELLILQLLAYLVVSLVLILKSFRKTGHSIFASGVEPLSWLRNFVLFMFSILVVLVVVKSVFVGDIGDYLIGSIISLVIYATSFNIIKSSEFFRESRSDTLHPRQKYVKSSLGDEEKEQILERVKGCMENDEEYRNHLVSLSSISKKLAIPVHHISQVINEKLDQSFFEMIASYRVELAKSMLADPGKSNLTIEDIADEVGYNSKSAFNRSFKKHTGSTPSEYRAQYDQS